MVEDVIKDWGGMEVSAMDVYRDIFRIGEGYIQQEGEPKGSYKANPIAYMRNDGAKKGKFRILFEDTFEELLKECQEADFCIVNGLTYFGHKNVMDHASKMFAMIFDLDGVNDKTMLAFLSGAFSAKAYPIPNYIVLSGHGVHLYYVFEDPIPLFPNLKLQLKDLKYALIDRMWNGYTSTEKSKQMQGINQGFRVIGGKTKAGSPEARSRAFRLNTHPFALSQLCEFVPEAMKVDESKLFRESKMTLDQAKEKYPEWYERVVVGKDKGRNRWKVEEKVHGSNPYALYDWWKSKIMDGAAYRHRYFCLMTLAIYAIKCGVSQERLETDARNLVPFLNDINPAQPFTDADVDSALECYDLKYCTFPIKDIEKISAIQIERNKRNGRPQATHMKIISSTRDVLYPSGEWRNRAGRPVGSGTKEQLVREYVALHPDSSVAEITRVLGISRTTVYKYRHAPVPPQTPTVVDYVVQMPDGSAVVIAAAPDLSAYDQLRLARVKAYQDKLAKMASHESEKNDKID